MDIILVSNHFSKARTITLKGRHVLAIGTSLLLLVICAVFAIQLAILRIQPSALSPELQAWLVTTQNAYHQKQQSYLRDGMDAMAARLGQMQAQLTRLDTLGARLAKLSGIKPQDFSFESTPPQGGPYIPAAPLSMADLDHQLTKLATILNDRNDKLVALETMLLQNSLDKRLLPTASPVKQGLASSNFGWRLDPFSGRGAMHEGVDFAAPLGTTIFAAADGIVSFAGYHPQYGNMVEIDHGNDIVTRYAHASRLLTREGQIVKRGSKIAEVGSTGRSTGNHVHFEVRYRGIAQNPTRFLKKGAG